MKVDIHPTYTEKSAITCACGTAFAFGSTMPKIEVEICSACHPYFTGNDKVIDSAGRVEKFKARATKTSTKAATKKK
ncbi:MAG: 50S ribosomal protein L31 [Patescibacteria group bacterium]